jgi:alpha-aminoadipic semialdehyde synthase
MERLIGIRREDKNKWEKRCPLTPIDVAFIKSKYSIKTVIQPSKIRIFKDIEYKKVGAEITEKLNAPVIFGIKEMPVDFFSYHKIYIFFSHTIKGQEHNIPMLKRMMQKRVTLIDYECIKDKNNVRLIAFGKYAGIAGIIETLWAAGKRLNYEGYKTPLINIKRPVEYKSLEHLKQDCKKIGKEIAEYGFSERLSPFVIGIVGYGNVSKGSQSILDYFPVEEIYPEKLENLKENHNKLYKVVFKEEHLVKRKDGKEFNLKDYYDNPENYESIFTKYLPYITILINAIYWEKKYPRLITKKHLKEHYNEKISKLKVIGDISCDIKGAIECTLECTNPGNPVFVYNPVKDKIRYGTCGNGLVIMAIDNLPSLIPRESSIYFSNILKNFTPDIVNASYPDNFEKCNLPFPIKRAVILYKGNLTPRYKHLEDFLRR